MYRIVLSIVSLILFVLLIVLVIIKYKKLLVILKEYELHTTYKKGLSIFCYVFFALSFIIEGVSLPLHFSNTLDGYWVCFSMGWFFFLLTFIVFCDAFLNFEALNDKILYAYRPFKEKQINIEDIKYISVFSMEVKFFDKHQKVILTTSSANSGIQKIVEKIKIDHPICDFVNPLDRIEQIKNSNDYETIRKYEMFGKELYDNKDKAIKNLKITLFVIFALLACVDVLVCAFSKDWFNLLWLILMFIIAPFVYSFTINNQNKKYELDMFELGYRHFKECKSYIGHSKYIFNGIKINCLIWIIFGLIFGSCMLAFSLAFKITDYSDLIKVQGTIEYTYESNSDSEYIAFGILEDDVEYRLSSIYLDEFDYSFFDEVKENGHLVVYAKDKVTNGTNQLNDEKVEVCQIYYVKFNGVEYLSYDSMLKSEIKNNNVTKIMAVVSYSISLLSLLLLIVGYIACKKNEKRETNEI